jgi:hypothetical protein
VGNAAVGSLEGAVAAALEGCTAVVSVHNLTLMFQELAAEACGRTGTSKDRCKTYELAIDNKQSTVSKTIRNSDAVTCVWVAHTLVGIRDHYGSAPLLNSRAPELIHD